MWSSNITIQSLISKHTPAFCTFVCQLEGGDSKISLKKARGKRQKYVESFCFTSSRNSDYDRWIFPSVHFHRGLAQRPFCWSWMPTAQTKEVVVTPHETVKHIHLALSVHDVLCLFWTPCAYSTYWNKKTLHAVKSAFICFVRFMEYT
jgi:hypothetical protein